MSYAEIVKFGKDGKGVEFAQIKNAWRGAAAIWDIIGDRYLGEFIPDYVKAMPHLKKEKHSRMAQEGALKEVWDCYGRSDISLTDKIVLGTTFDWVTVKRKDIPDLLKAFREFDGETSLKEQADAIEQEFNADPELKAIAWCQTSVCENKWTSYKHNRLSEESFPYNIKRHKQHFDLFSDFAEQKEPA